MSAENEHPGASSDEPAWPARSEWDRLRSAIAVSLSSLVLVGAGIAVLQVDASARESNSARETTRTAVRAMRANVVAATVGGLQPVLDAEREFLAYRPPLDTDVPSLTEAAGFAPLRTPATRSDLQRSREAVSDLGVGQLLTRLQVEAERLTLKQGALATTRITWNDRSTQYTTVIAVLAVALFLVGFALVVGGPVRRASFILGLVVGLFVIGWAAWIYHLPIPSTADAAIEAAARGAVATDNGDYQGAIASYGRALAIDGDFETAYAGRARARLLAANPDYASTRAVVDSRGSQIALAVEDARRAFALDRRDVVSVYLLALTSFYTGEYQAAERAIEKALELSPEVPDLWLLESAIQVALGEPAAATASFRHALSLLQGTVPSARTRLLASTYLSYLAWLERHDVAHARTARRLTGEMVSVETAHTLGRELPQAAPPTGAATVRGLHFADGKLMLELRWRNLPARTALAGIGYERPLPRGAWTQPADLALFATVSGSGSRDIVVPLHRVCEPAGVRVDVYLDGVRTVSRTGPGVEPTC